MLSGWPKLRNANGMLSGYPRARNSNGMLSGWPRPAGAYADLVLATAGLVGYWKLDEAAGATTARDSSPNGYHMTHTGASITPGASPGLVPGATCTNYASATGASTRRTAGPATTVTDNWTIEAWAAPYALPNPGWAGNGGMIMMNGLNSNGYGLGIGSGGFGSGSGLTVLFGGVSFWYPGYTFPTAGVPYHVAAVRRSGTTSAYVNGVQVGSTTATAPPTPTGYVEIGGYAGDGYQFRGKVGHVAVYNQPLTAAQILAHYTTGLAG